MRGHRGNLGRRLTTRFSAAQDRRCNTGVFLVMRKQAVNNGKDRTGNIRTRERQNGLIRGSLTANDLPRRTGHIRFVDTCQFVDVVHLIDDVVHVVEHNAVQVVNGQTQLLYKLDDRDTANIARIINDLRGQIHSLVGQVG